MAAPRALLAAFALVVVPAAPSDAITVLTLTGSGTESPGIGLTGCGPQTVSLSGTILAANLATYHFTFNGNTNACACDEFGDGAMSGDIAGFVTYHRTNCVTLRIYGTVNVNGRSEPFSVSGAWIPTSTNPTNSFTVALTNSNSAQG